jgi:hypothetical protein
MLIRSIGVLAVGALLTSAGQAPPQAGNEPYVVWATSWADALREAQERNVPILFTVQADENPGSQQMESAFRDGSFIAASRRIVCVVAHGELKHGTKDVYVNKQKVSVCRLYEGMTCDVHKNLVGTIGKFFKAERDFGVPAQIWCRPTGEELFKYEKDQGYPQSSGDMIKDMEKAMERVSGPKMTRKEWIDLRTLLDQGQDAQGRTEYKVALGCYKKVMECKFEKFAKLGKDYHDSLINQCVRMVEKGVKQYHQYDKDTKQHKEVKPLLQKIAKELKGTPAGDAAEKALKELK